MQITEKAKQTIITAAIAVASTAAILVGGYFVKNHFWPAKPDMKSAINVVLGTDAEKKAQLDADKASKDTLDARIRELTEKEDATDAEKKELGEKKAEVARLETRIKGIESALEANKKKD